MPEKPNKREAVPREVRHSWRWVGDNARAESFKCDKCGAVVAHQLLYANTHLEVCPIKDRRTNPADRREL